MVNISEDRLIGANEVRARLGCISDMTLWRWLDSPEVDFPRPIYVRRRRYWRESDLAAWVAAQAAFPRGSTAPATGATPWLAVGIDAAGLATYCRRWSQGQHLEPEARRV